MKSLARRVHHILSNGGTTSSVLATYFERRGTPKCINGTSISTAVKDAAGDIGLYKADVGYTRADVSSHSLRAGGAMAMHLNKVDPNTIKKQGRWRSDTFLMYIHEQLSSFAAGLSTKMSTHIPFRNICGPQVLGAAPQA